ncbi:MAG: glycosyltransferase family 39 protein [Planctomycetota bacterium]
MNAPHNAPIAVGRNESILFWTLLLATLVVGVAMRLPAFLPSPMNYHLVRQYAGIVNARVVQLYWQGVEPRSTQAAWFEENRKSLVEPPILELSMLAIGSWDGESWPRWGCVLSSLFWLAGGFFLFDLVLGLVSSRVAALGAVTYFLLCPFSIVISQSFQPEGLMILAFLISLWFLVRFLDDRWSRVVATGMIHGLAVAVKPGILLFPLLGGYLGFRASRDGWKRSILDPRTYAHGLLLILPSLLYAAFFLREHFGTKIVPHLLLSTEFYVLWGTNLRATVAWIPLACSLVGVFILARDFRSFLGVGLTLGYILYALVFSWHTATHDYYQAPLVPIVALGIGGLLAKVLHSAR